MTKLITRPLFLLCALACNGDDADKSTPDADTDTDTDADSDTDTDADADTDTDTDTDTGTAVVGPYFATRPPNPTCLAPDRPSPALDVRLVNAYPNISTSQGVQLIQQPDDPNRIWVVRQNGRLEVFENDPAATDVDVVLDIDADVNSSGSELGLLTMAFHPDWANNRHVFVYYTTGNAANVGSRIVRYTSTDGGLTLDPATEEVILTQDQPFTNHNGGMLNFGPDGYLYFGFGDGGSGGDPFEYGQDPDTLLSKMIRIDVDGALPYTIPADNPFASGVEARPEIWAIGLRNPWRWSFDTPTGQLWLADVGQNRVEEVNIIERGGNYGWNIMEGDQCYNPGCDPSNTILPVETTLHSDGHFSITGGVVYRGNAIPELIGKYVFADYVSGTTWYLETDPRDGSYTKVELLTGVPNVTSIDRIDDEIVFLSRGFGFLRLEPDGAPVPSTLPATLAETGCFEADGTPGPMLVPYDVSHTFWADGAEKNRWMAIPDGTTIAVEADGRLDLPIGSVLAKEFIVGGKKVETRLMVRHDDGGWAGYDYAWDETETSATLLPAGLATEGGGGIPWTIPSRGECMQCHNSTAGGPLSASVPQLDFVSTQPNGYVENQIDQLLRLAMIDPVASRGGLLPAIDDATASVEDRARAWLDVNCAYCHQPDAPGRGDLDLRYTTALADTGLCAAPTLGDLGIPNARLVAPGEPERSIVSDRIGRRDSYQMPPLATNVVDTVGSGVVNDWISALSSCP
jgi:uncharacterized repeat protein (TIGR03806 family)